MIYKIAALLCMAVFYGFYFAKMILQKRRGITTNQMAKGKVKDKSYYIELLLKISTYLIPIVEVVSIIFMHFNLIHIIFGLYFAVVGDVVFAIAIIAMRDSWRAGLADDDDEGRELVTGGIYRYSRNPAFLGFDLVYIGILIIAFNPVLLISTIFAIIMMHLQILNEEAFLENVYKNAYLEYKAGTSRYAGIGKISLDKIILYCYVITFVWSVLYFVTIAIYGGPFLSWIWLWPVIAIFSAVRIRMLLKKIEGQSKIPSIARAIYRVCFVCSLAVFIFVEAQIVSAMHAHVPENLEYVVVLGAGLRGTYPTNPLRVRIERAYEYMSNNANTILIASGGQGFGEDISEAQCIKNKLVERGIDADRIILEDKSTSTEENLINTLKVLGDANANVGIITNGFHEYRANLIAKSVGYNNVTSVPAITLFPVGIHYTVREFFGVVQYLISAYI